ncbi:glutathione S-transferase family protein [Corallincola spongiicola]|uniref:Glutathione S-transferase family protein n=1 Tax=Corallincola spongiicola TaxID=2520508 RepID=A0ABY1WP54_9GAMM|nr:glutathione S-transferase family protein [Corallincola spongiicola]TAA45857.1 glutathione S-transferase family protein [Corallincola spongiicola]
MYRLFEMPASGNCYKVRLMMSHLDIPYERYSIDIIRGESRTPEFLNLNCNGKVPVLQLPDGRTLPESNAILWFLAENTAYLPQDSFERAQVLQWMFFEQYSHEPYIATSRFWRVFADPSKHESELAAAHPKGEKALRVLERHLSTRRFMVADSYTIADIALYAYTHVADEGGFNLECYPAIRRWLQEVASQPGHVTICG